MKDIFKPIVNSKARPDDIMVHFKTTKYDTKSLTSLESKMWNHLPPNLKFKTTFHKFKEYIETCFRPKCRCSVCANVNGLLPMNF